MKISLYKILNQLKKYAILITFGVIVSIAIYLLNFFYQNIYLSAAEKLPLENITVKEKINTALLEQVKTKLSEKEQTAFPETEIKNIFE